MSTYSSREKQEQNSKSVLQPQKGGKKEQNFPGAESHKAIQKMADASSQVEQAENFHSLANPEVSQRMESEAPLQLQDASPQHEPKSKKSSGASGNLPPKLRSGVESLSGQDMSDVKVNYNSSKPAQLNALATAQGNQIDLGPGQKRHLPHEAWHVAQQKQGRVKATTQMKGAAINDDPGLEKEADVMGRKAFTLDNASSVQMKKVNSSGAIMQQNPEQEAAANDIANAVVPGVAATGRARVLNYLTHGLGKGGAHFWRSKEVRAFRAKLKMAARAQAWGDIMEIVKQDEVFDDAELEIGPAMKEHLEIVAKDLAYSQAKDVVDERIQALSEDWISRAWPREAMLASTQSIAKSAALIALSKGRKAAIKAAQSAAIEHVNSEVEIYMAQAKAAKNEVLKPKQEEEVSAVQDQQEIASMVSESAKGLGMKTLKQAIKANTTDEGLGIVGKLLDQAIPLAGEQVSLDVSLQIPTGDGVSYVVLKLSGSAGRGITGFSTSGVTNLGDPRRLEVMAQFSVGVGAETFGLKGEASLGFFIRAGSDQGTAATMKALSYGGYRAASGIKSEFGNWWAGSGKGSLESKVELAEKWAAAIEEQVFMEQDEDNPTKNAFADVGGSLDLSGGIKTSDVFEMGLDLGGKLFKRYNEASLKESLQADDGSSLFGQVVKDKDQAKERRKKAKGRTTGSFGGSASFDVKINGQGVGFSGSLSAETDANENVAGDNWGAEITAKISAGQDPLSKLEKIAVGVVTGALGVTQGIAKMLDEKKKAGAGVNILADATQILNAGMFKNQISEGLSKAWSVDGSKFDMGLGGKGVPEAAPGIKTSSDLQIAIIFGKSGGKGVFRIEVRDSKSVEIAVGIGSLGLSISASKGRRLFAAGYEDGGFKSEILGFRPGG